MVAFPLWVVLALGATGPCFVPNDATPGWKQVALPDDARALAAPEGVDQFRADDGVTVVDDRSGLYLAGHSDGLGVTQFDFPLGGGGRSLEVRFANSLRGAKVDVTAHGEFGAMALMREERVGASSLSLTWGQNEVQSVTVRVHGHLRKEPVLLGWRSVRRVAIERLPVSAAFRLRRSLYYRQPAGGPVTLCQDPGRELAVKPDAPGPAELPTPVSLKRL